MNKRPPRNGETAKKIQNTLLVDGNSLFKTAFFGAKTQYNQYGVHIGGLYQFLTTLRKLLNEDLYHRVYVFWDGKFSGKLRYEIYKDYKIKRGKDYENGTHPIDESELLQREVIEEYLNQMYVRQYKDEVVEGDDLIAYYCLNKKENEKITICTTDRDMAQLIRENIRIYFLDLKQYVDITNFSSYFCYHIENAALYKTILGDSSDSIKGIKGLGSDGKTLLSLFPEISERKVSLTEIIESAKKQQETRLQNKQKPKVVLDNIINGVTDGLQGKNIYEINDVLVNLKHPLLTDKVVEDMNNLINKSISDDRDIGVIFEYMKRDGMDKTIGEYRYPDYLTPFQKLIEREKLIF